MKVLVIDEWLPWPLESGKKIRSFNLITRLALKHEILYLAYVRLPEEKEKVEMLEKRGISVIAVEDVRLKKWTLAFYTMVILNFLSRKPFSTVYHIKKPFIEKLKEVLATEKPDLVHCEWTNLAPFLEGVHGIPRVISAHNVESDIWKRLGENASNPLIRLLGWQQARKIERLEREWYAKVDLCIAVSDEDAKVIRGYGAKVGVVENGVDVEYYDVCGDNVDQNWIIFVASFDTFSNQDGVHFFVKEILPLIKEKNPDISFWIVGKDPPSRIREYASLDRCIHLTGSVPDVRQYLARAAICIVPLRIGGGSRLKILEALAMKKAVVSTSVGAEGLVVRDGEHILIADQPRDFAARVAGLLRDPVKRRSLGLAGYQLVRSTYDWEKLGDKQHEIWSRLV